MASTTAALMTAAARRLSCSIASAMVLQEVSGSHKLTIDGCAPSKNIATGWYWDSKPFRVGGHSWRIRYYPDERDDGRTISFHLELDAGASKHDRTGSVKSIEFSVLDQSGNPVPEFTRAITGPCVFDCWSRSHGFRDFVKWKDLEASGCLKDDRFAVRCDVTVTADLTKLGIAYPDDDGAAPVTAAVPVMTEQAPAAKLHDHLAELLWKDRRGADVTIDVGGEATFDAHGWLLADRSPIFREELLTAAHHRIEINGVDPKVFEAVLHYMYNNALPEKTMEDNDDDAIAMAQGLFAAADRFKVDGLKLACEVTLSKRIDVSTAAEILAVAEQHSCRALKDACLEFMSRPENMKAVLESEGYEKAKATIYPLVTELAMKQ